MMRLLSLILSSGISNLQSSFSASQDPCMQILPILLIISLEENVEPQVSKTTPGCCGSCQCLPFPFSVQCTKAPVLSTLHKRTYFSKSAPVHLHTPHLPMPVLTPLHISDLPLLKHTTVLHCYSNCCWFSALISLCTNSYWQLY